MRTILVIAIICYLARAQLTNKLQGDSMNMKSNFKKFAKECNVYDEANYCQQIVIDQKVSLTAVSYKCRCPTGWRCPSHITDTFSFTECQFDELRHWHRCQLKCTPEDSK